MLVKTLVSVGVRPVYNFTEYLGDIPRTGHAQPRMVRGDGLDRQGTRLGTGSRIDLRLPDLVFLAVQFWPLFQHQGRQNLQVRI